MTPKQFVYWLQGFVEISGKKELSPEQMVIVQDHLDLVLTRVTPERRPEQKKCSKVPTDLEIREIIKKVEAEKDMPAWYRFKEKKSEPKPILRCSGPINHAWPQLLDLRNQTYC